MSSKRLTTGEIQSSVTTLKERLSDALPYIGANGLAIAGAIVFAFPLYFLAVTSTLPINEMFSFPPRLLPGSQFIENYNQLFFETNFLQSMLNSFIYAGGSTIGVLVVSTTAGYGLAKFEFFGRDPLFYMVLITLAIPFQLLSIPLFQLLVDFGLINTYTGLILPALATPIGLFFMKQNIEQTIPDDMLNSARMDGASEFQTFYHIVLPLLRPGLAALAVLMFLLRWNALYWPLIVMRSEEKYVLTVFLANIAGGVSSRTPWDIIMPAALVATIPILLIFIFMQKHFVEGLVSGSLRE